MDVSNDPPDQIQSDHSPLHVKQLFSDDGTTKHETDSRPKGDDSSTTQLKQMMDWTLQFLSTCSSERLLSILVCLMGATYFILGRLGLVLIGTAIGIALHASWEGAGCLDTSEPQSSRRKQLSLNIAHKLLEWDNKLPDTGNNEGISTEAALATGVQISSLGPATAAALNSLIDATVRDYVNYWYEPILPSELTFPMSCRRLLTSSITSVSSHLSRKRTADTFLEFLTNSSSMVIVFLSELCAASEAAGTSIPAEDAIMQYLELNPESSLSSLLSRQQQHQKLKTVSEDILVRFLDSSAYNCLPVRSFLREILTGSIFDSTIQSMSRPEFINGWIIYLFSEGEPEIMSAIDAGVENARNHGVAAAKAPEQATAPVSAPPSRELGSNADQATEEAILEARRLSDLMASQNTPEDVKKAKQKERDNIDTALENPVNDASQKQHLLDAASTEEVEVQGVRSSSLHESATLQPSGTSQSDNVGSPPAVTLHRASITLDDSVDSGEKAALKSKPTSDYLVQVEPQSGRSSGWMLFKKYADFEAIHETLGTIARLNQLDFGNSHPTLPPWKGRSRQILARDLERYLQDALQLEPLAESLTLRRFLGKDDINQVADSPTKSSFVFPGQAAFENVGKGVLGVLTSAPKGVSGGSKAVLEGVSGVFGGGPNKKTPTAPGTDGDTASKSSSRKITSRQSGDGSKEERNGIRDSTNSSQRLESSDTDGLTSPSEMTSFTESSDTPVATPESEEIIVRESDERTSSDFARSNHTTRLSSEDNRKSAGILPDRGQNSFITADETQMAVELIFAVINELYSLSSAWNIRRTLLNAAKSYILRPGNPSLETIRGLLQESMIDNNTTDEAIGSYLARLRENALPTAEELSSWPPPTSDAEKERQREAARRALVQRGLPQAITSVMGAVASREALGKVFDSLQVEIIARGFVFSILLQALRAMLL
ncbi:PX domain protein [Aspergillus stella-maris]|uniref:PX domain protein n=1 Tax=Aspergillus stella-maris TaxID=1810926 RepID=UPI003CCD5634